MARRLIFVAFFYLGTLGLIHTAAASPHPLQSLNQLIVTRASYQLQSPQQKTREAALKTLAQMGDDAIFSVPALSNALMKESNSVLRKRIIAILAEMGPRAKAAIRAIQKFLRREPQADIRINALQAMIKIDSRALRIVKTIEKVILEDSNARVRRAALAALAELGSFARRSLKTVHRALLDDDDPEVKQLSAKIICQYDHAAALWLSKALESPKQETRLIAARSIGRLGHKAQRAKASLMKIIRKDPSPNVQAAAALALEQVGGKATSIIPTLTSALMNGTNQEENKKVALILSNLGPVALSSVAKGLMAPNPLTRIASAWALAKISPRSVSVRPALLYALDDLREKVRLYATIALGRMRGKATSEARAKIRELLLKDRSSSVRIAAARALGEMGELAKAEVEILNLARYRDSSARVRRAAAMAMKTILKTHNIKQYFPQTVALNPDYY